LAHRTWLPPQQMAIALCQIPTVMIVASVNYSE
jgi:hypothetical protein